MGNRILKYDVVRTIAIMCVVLCHATEMIYSFTAEGWLSVGKPSRIFMFLAFTVGRLGVPLFLFLSGALLLNKNFDTDESVKRFYKRNLLSLYITNTIWTLIYNIIALSQGKDIELKNVIKEVLLLKQSSYSHMWYMPMIILLYIAVPFLAKTVRSFSRKTLSLFLGMGLITFFVLPVVNRIFATLGISENLELLYSQSYLGGAYGIYMITGYYASNCKKSPCKPILFFIGAVFGALSVAIQLFSYSRFSKQKYNLWYTDIILLVCSLCIYLFICSIDFSRMGNAFSKAIMFMSKISFGIFYLHGILLIPVRNFVIKTSFINPVKVFLNFALITVICTTVCGILSLNRYTSKYLLCAKK